MWAPGQSCQATVNRKPPLFQGLPQVFEVEPANEPAGLVDNKTGTDAVIEDLSIAPIALSPG